MSGSDQVTRRLRLYNRILQFGSPVEPRCEFCFLRGHTCIMDSKYQKCAECTRRGRKCERQFHDEKEWNRLEKSRKELRDKIRKVRESIATSYATLNRLERQEEYLNERGSRMLVHDSNMLERLDEENPPSAEDLQELERSANEEAARIAAVSKDLSLSQVMDSPSFWENFDSAVAGGIPSPTGGNQSSSR
ncbi:uncharacterized protein ACHE_70038S [Aspergillus chevalieri]|uniref:Zn(2)-C6 fungal-type domain-containing protein n=1 Tax=Aspergillus chevalieri TaxID=182096 RepID=A0A7R7VPS4_ASPCH|nr:uncharacterized protein ACHE_30884S [Aspergillus chevalieri]XP_043136415.1 uncharacterized protein ACHE_40457S [Aspergillus chevalieri]XP_043137324.1 uncharacterized protein ACHE_41366S [Aspergillus chevalieri]XP_043139717.1 uncharacterized protein ACHE_70038S [Aspergillus chevalieri]BCR86897.1 hypothetical protein ACHE_30884S [Aspergillus chevalieri]BCR87893.1 hypothetical protein ACHE_40457S [Aspergillus chevalieri]BCR88802.1 hypothetical protein ACHE_41366S [Aspergillus chevalieri]BCR9